MKYFYRIKAPMKDQYGPSWSYKNFDVGYIEANSKMEAREKLNKEYQDNLVMRSKREDIGFKNFFFVGLHEPDEYWDKYWTQEHICKNEECKKEYTIMQKKKYFDFDDCGYDEFCCLECQNIYNDKYRPAIDYEDQNRYPGVIYKITNKVTGKSYIGKTTQYFTYRWFQHFKSNNTKKFGIALQNSKLEDWIFEVIESVSKLQKQENSDILNKLERYYIEKFNVIEKGYNSK